MNAMLGLSTVDVDTGQRAGRSRNRGLILGRGQRAICPPKTPRSSQEPTREPSVR